MADFVPEFDAPHRPLVGELVPNYRRVRKWCQRRHREVAGIVRKSNVGRSETSVCARDWCPKGGEGGRVGNGLKDVQRQCLEGERGAKRRVLGGDEVRQLTRCKSHLSSVAAEG